jgi:hypothetical protein
VRIDGNVRWAAWVFAGFVVVGVGIVLYQGRDQWFFFDDWDFLAHRTGGSFGDLMRPHFEHWTAVPVLVYRALWWMVGLRHYWPYQIVVVALHVAAAVLLRVIMRRAGVDPWIATVAASLFLFLGAGRDDIEFAFQMTFTGALTFGLAQLVLADHDGRFDRRDFAGVACGLISIMCSGVGVMMVLAVGIATLLRRGWKMALAQSGPLAAIFLVWFITFGRSSYRNNGKPTAVDVLRFARDAIASAFDGLGQLPGVGILLALVVVVGLALEFTRRPSAELRVVAGPTVVLAAGGVAFSIVSAVGRATGPNAVPPNSSRYIYIVSGMVLPALALAASAIVDRWRIAFPMAIAVFLVGLPANIAQLAAHGEGLGTLGDPDLVLTMARLPLAQKVPPTAVPMAPVGNSFTVGWLLAGVASGKVPPPRTLDPGERAAAELRLSINQTKGSASGTCTAIQPQAVEHLAVGNRVVFNAPRLTLERIVAGRQAGSATYHQIFGDVLVADAPVDVRIGRGRRQTALLCR